MEDKSMWGVGIFLVLLIWLVAGGAGNFFGGNKNSVSEEMLTTVQQGNLTRDLLAQQENTTQGLIIKTAFDQQGVALADAKAEIAALKTQIHCDAQFSALQREIQAVACHMPRTAPVYVQGTSCAGYPYPGVVA